MPWLIKHPEVVYTDLEDGAVLLHLETKFYYSLNEAGQTIWRNLDSSRSVEDMVRRLTTEYDVEEGQAHASVSTLLLELERECLVLRNQAASMGTAMVQERSEGPTGPVMPFGKRKPFTEPELIKHDEPLHEVVMNPFDPQLPLAE